MKTSAFSENVLPYRIMLWGSSYYPQVFSTVWENFEDDTGDDDDDEAEVCFDTEADARTYLKMRAERRVRQYREYLTHRADQAEHIRVAEIWLENIDSAIVFSSPKGAH